MEGITGGTTLLDALRRWRARRAYRASVRSLLRLALSPLSAPVVNRILKAHPGVRAVVDQCERDGATPERAAVGVLCALLPTIIETTLSEDRKAHVLEELNRTATEMTKASEIVRASDDSFVRLVFNMEHHTHMWSQLGLINATEYEILLGEVVGALQGKPHDLRVADRLLDKLYQLLFPQRADSPNPKSPSGPAA